MRKSTVLLCIMVVGFFGCSTETEDLKVKEEEKGYTQAQEKTFTVLNGKFQLITKIMEGVEIKGEILTFSKRYDKPVDKSNFIAHGEGHSEDVIGKGSLSYDFYYFVTEEGHGLKIYKKESTSSSPFKDCTMSIANNDKFTLYYKSALPGGGIDTYYRVK